VAFLAAVEVKAKADLGSRGQVPDMVLPNNSNPPDMELPNSNNPQDMELHNNNNPQDMELPNSNNQDMELPDLLVPHHLLVSLQTLAEVMLEVSLHRHSLHVLQ
jgi:hypothetical protein